MLIETATEHSVLVELSAADLKKWNMTYDALDLQNMQTKAVVQNILCEIQTQIGRTLPQQGLEIDLLPVRNGGCLMIVSGIPASRAQSGTWEVCALEDADALLDLLSFLHKSAWEQTSARPFISENACFLALENVSDSQRRLLREFGRVEKLTELRLAVLSEHAGDQK